MFPAYCVLLIVTVKTLKVFDQYTGTMLLCLVVYLSNTPKLYIQINMPFHFKECFNILIDILFRQGDLQEAAEEKAREKEDLMISQMKMDLKNVSGKKTLDHSMYPQIILYKN